MSLFEKEQMLAGYRQRLRGMLIYFLAKKNDISLLFR